MAESEAQGAPLWFFAIAVALVLLMLVMGR
jgi:hypothetical protein